MNMYKVDIDKCSACETCIEVCPTEAISMVDGHASIDVDECIECGSCAAECPEEAISEVD
jgi:ferredoxin